MTRIQELINKLDETALSRIGIPHDEARISYSLNKNTVDSFEEFTKIIGEYCNHHYQACISKGGRLSSHEAVSKAKELIEQEYREKNGDIVSAYNDAHNGTNTGMRGILDIIANQLKMESIRRYMRNVFDEIVAPNSWDEKVEIIRQFVAQHGFQFSTALDVNQIERYASNYRDLIQSYVNGLRSTSSIFRRL